MKEENFQELQMRLRAKLGEPFGFVVPGPLREVETVVKGYFRHYGRVARLLQPRVSAGKKSLVMWKFNGDVVLFVRNDDVVELFFSKKIEKWVKFFVVALLLRKDEMLRPFVARCENVDDVKSLVGVWEKWRREGKGKIRFGRWLGMQPWMKESLPFWRRRVFLTTGLRRSIEK